MCGITGYININRKPVPNTSAILNMLRVQKHRGPDDSGIIAFSIISEKSLELNVQEPSAIDGNFEGVLGFNRLSILDLSLNGHQPMASPDGKVLLTLNGEIYNAFDYKKELQDWGYKFKSTTDTEIVLALYLRYGFEGILSRLNGMFALVLADLEKRELFIARDRFGIKPMYYISTGETLAFSSELKSFRFIENFNFKLEEKQLDEYLLFRNNFKGTLFRDIQSLDPGYYLSFTHVNGLVRKRYFDLNGYVRYFPETDKIATYVDQLEELLSKSVLSQLISDVKLGCQLSGGIDSSLVTWLANKNTDKGLFEAVSIIFNDQRFSEERYVDRITKKLAIPVHKFLLDSGYYYDNFEKATWHLEAPINHPNTIAIYKLSQRAKEYVTVLLSGEGADEVFGGYSRFYDICYPFFSRRLLHEVKKSLIHPLDLAKYFRHESRSVLATSYITPSIAKKLWEGFNIDRATLDRRLLYNSLSGSLFDRQVKYEMHTYLPDLLIRQDKMSMAHSIENRVPFLDNEVVENSFRIPEKFLLPRKSPEGYNTEKYLLKKIVAKNFGNDYAFRAKMGFSIPLTEFFIDKHFYTYLVEKTLPGIKNRGIFNHQIISQWFSRIHTLGYLELEALWIVITFEIWATLYLDDTHENSNS